MKNNNLLGHLEHINDTYTELVDKIPTEDKLIMSHEETGGTGLEPWEISEITQTALGRLPVGIEEHVDLGFDIIYEAILEALSRSRK